MAKPAQLDPDGVRATLRQALREMVGLLDRGEDLPASVKTALLKYSAAQWKEINKRVLAPKIEERQRGLGKPRTKLPAKGESSLEATAKLLGVSVSTVARAIDDHEDSGRGSRLDGPQRKRVRKP